MTATLEDARLILAAGAQLLAEATAAAKTMTDGGKKIDDHQVITERVAYAATEAVAAHEVLAALVAWSAEGKSTPMR
jgi:alkylation response protein AidB-like acyl-CoA dehydrogenase